MIEENLVRILFERALKITTAESCTGGMCCAALVDVANASRVLDMSFVTYANEAKIKLLGVDENTINTHGVVSEQVAREMACGVCKTADCEIGVGVSGIAGPTGGTDTKPVGMVCFGFCVNGNTVSYTKYFGNIGRNNVRTRSMNFVFETLLKLL